MLSSFSYSQSQPSYIYSAAAEMDHWRGTGGTPDLYNLQRCPLTRSTRHLIRCSAVQCTILTSPFLWHLPTTHLSLLHRLSTTMEVADPKHGRSMTGPSPLHDVSKAFQIQRVGDFFSLDFCIIAPSCAASCISYDLSSRCTACFQVMFIYRDISEYCLYATLIGDIP